MKTITYDETIYKLVPVEPTDKMTFVGQSMRYESPLSIGSIYNAMIVAVPDTLPGVVEHSGEPVIQARFRDEQGNVDPWTEPSAKDLEYLGYDGLNMSVPTGLGATREFRKLFTHPPAQPDTAGLNTTLRALREKIMDRNRTVQFFKDECAAANVRIAELEAQIAAQVDACQYATEGRKQKERIAELESQDPFELVYCKLKGADATHGLASCDDFKDWKAQLAAQAGQECHICHQPRNMPGSSYCTFA